MTRKELNDIAKEARITEEGRKHFGDYTHKTNAELLTLIEEWRFKDEEPIEPTINESNVISKNIIRTIVEYIVDEYDYDLIRYSSVDKIVNDIYQDCFVDSVAEDDSVTQQLITEYTYRLYN